MPTDPAIKKLEEYFQAHLKAKKDESNVWSAFGPAVCINLIDRNDRMENVQKEFDRVGVKVHFHRVVKSPLGGRWGCYESHRNILRTALEQGLDNVLVFEDDVYFDKGWEKHVAKAAAYIEAGNPYDALYLGHAAIYVVEKIGDCYNLKTGNLHAYVVSKGGLKKFLDRTPEFEDKLKSPDMQSHVDHLTNSAWTKIIVPEIVSPIVQDDAGTNVEWLDEVPPEYTGWFQFNILKVLQRIETKLLSWTLWLPPVVRPTAVTIACAIDDGRVQIGESGIVKNLALAWVIVVLTLVAVVRSPPPGGVVKFGKVFVDGLRGYFLRAQKKKAEESSSETKKTS